MKKFALVLVAVLTVMFTGCKTETSKVTITVEDTAGAPVDKCPIIYADYASIILGLAFPSPESLATGIPEGWEYAETNAYGTVVLNIPLSVSKLKYSFYALDRGSNQWPEKTVELHRGVNEDIKFVVNK
jgi:hypothetical protein